jgi:hypothetical protein
MASAINPDVARVEKKCAICRATFMEINNTGEWKCRQHPGQIVNNRFTCCNMYTMYNNYEEFHSKTISIARLGCARCDHRTTYAPYTMQNGVNFVPRHFAPIIATKDKIRALEIRKRDDKKELYVYRFDRKSEEENADSVTMHHLASIGEADDSHLIAVNLTIKK